MNETSSRTAKVNFIFIILLTLKFIKLKKMYKNLNSENSF